MKQVLEQGSKWPLQPLDEENKVKDVKEALVFGNHKGAIQQQNLLKKLVTNDVIQGFALPLPLNKIIQFQESFLLLSTSKHRTPITDVAK